MKRWKVKGIWSLAGLAIAGAVMLLQKSQLDGTLQSWLKITSNGFLSGGAVLALLGFFVLAINAGLFDGIAYGASKMRKRSPGERQEYASYYDYITRDKSKKPFPAMLWPGLIYIIIAVLLTVLYYLV